MESIESVMRAHTTVAMKFQPYAYVVTAIEETSSETKDEHK